MKLAFMSSVCPKLSLGELLSAGERHGYEGIEFRPQWHQAHGSAYTVLKRTQGGDRQSSE